MKVFSVMVMSALMLTSCGGFQRTNESVVLSDNRTSDNNFPTDNCLNYLLYKQNVTVAVVAGRIACLNEYLVQDEEWKDSIRTGMVVETENHLLDMAGYYSGHSLNVVDRERVNNIIIDYDTNNLTRIPKDLRDDLRKQTGATHILLLNYMRSYDGRSHTRDVTSRFLVNVATGNIEAVDVLEERNPFSSL